MPASRLVKYSMKVKKNRKIYKTKYSQKVKKYSKNKKMKTLRRSYKNRNNKVGGMFKRKRAKGETPLIDEDSISKGSVYDPDTGLWTSKSAGYTFTEWPNPEKRQITYYKIHEDGHIIGYDDQDVEWSIDDKPLYYTQGLYLTDDRITQRSPPDLKNIPVIMPLSQYIVLREHQRTLLRNIFNNIRVELRPLHIVGSGSPSAFVNYRWNHQELTGVELLKAILSTLLDVMNSHIHGCWYRFRYGDNQESYINNSTLYKEMAQINKTIEFINEVAEGGTDIYISEYDYKNVFWDGKLFKGMVNFMKIIIEDTVPPSQGSPTSSDLLPPAVSESDPNPRPDHPPFLEFLQANSTDLKRPLKKGTIADVVLLQKSIAKLFDKNNIILQQLAETAAWDPAVAQYIQEKSFTHPLFPDAIKLSREIKRSRQADLIRRAGFTRRGGLSRQERGIAKKNKTVKKGGMYNPPPSEGAPQGILPPPPSTPHLTSSSVLSSSNSIGVGSSQNISTSPQQSTPSPTYTPQPILPLSSAPFLPLYNPRSPSDRLWEPVTSGPPNIPDNRVWVPVDWQDLNDYGTNMPKETSDEMRRLGIIPS